MANKIKQETLNELQALINELNNIQARVGSLEIQKYKLLETLDIKDRELKTIRAEINEKYGDVTIDVNTGEYTNNVKAQAERIHDEKPSKSESKKQKLMKINE